MPGRTMSKIHSKTLVNHHHIPSTFMQTISNTMYLIYVCQCDKSTTKPKFYAPTFLYPVEQNIHRFLRIYHFVIVGVYHG